MRHVSKVFTIAFVIGACASAKEEDCLRCHTAVQAVMAKSTRHGAVATCSDCHADHTKQAGIRSGGSCGYCHAELTTKEFVHEPAKKQCALCHDPHDPTRLHAAVNALCLECHSTAAQQKFEANDPVSLFAGRIELPARPFSNLHLLALTEDRGHPVANHPVLTRRGNAQAEMNCLTCHNPHGANNSPSLLVTESATPIPLCQRCHK